ncbi:MAG TPA: class I SAM-dependent methyltransferase [Alphaproteobacteria bacterium]|uniref:class I SAM-dependent methyltransferase n=1 Tax=Vibrio TaxID=662 RepID=UPI0000670604|nr:MULTISPECIES: class I SAM-dependent methyltransferase [Vibrio]HAG52598.1 class I SAM-dependent methyltransferase [Alphaproteobacteria bacterium]EAP95341.1 hypothetical protein V12B01_01072 [Vibrio splendidus 12B01]NOI90080.1 class I SAM-dependent methyltransferase [Vibrio splendidus]OCH61718.1 hypothetical protein A6D94_17570 [Vibrio splendidus]OMO33319.1 hypothetical protein BH582_08285 [Vibrio sp. 10N.222.47.A9]
MKDKELVTKLYNNASFLSKIKQTYREKICPFRPIERFLPEGDYSILDVGCGSGWFGLKNTVFKKGISYVGLDTNPASLAEAKKALLNANNQNIVFESTTHEYIQSFKQLDSKKLFDIIVVIDVLHHVKYKDLNEFISEVTKKLAPDGMLIIKDMSTKPFYKKAVNQLHDLILAREWIEHIDTDYLIKVMCEHRLSLVHKEEYSSGPYAHYLTVFSHYD